MICHEDLQLQQKKLIIAFFGNLLAYCLNFVQSFFAQVYNNEPRAEYYYPKDVSPILPSMLIEEKQRVWNGVTIEKFYLYRSHMSRTSSSCKELLQICLDLAMFESKYGQKTVIAIFSNLDVLSIWREAARVNWLLEKKQLPVLLFHRQRMSMSIMKWHKKYKEDLERDIAEDKIYNPQ
jgi:hypothetical protein